MLHTGSLSLASGSMLRKLRTPLRVFQNASFLKDLCVDIKDEEFCCNDDDPVFLLQVSTGSNDNIKPELVMKAFYEYLQLEEEAVIAIHRVELYQGEKNQFESLGV